jgi:hypothetical protein
MKQFISDIYHKYKNYIPADLWAFLIFILITIIGLIIVL